MTDENLNIEQIKNLIKEANLDIDSYNKKVLMDGLAHIKSRVEYNKQLKEFDNCYIEPKDLNGGWISNYVRDTLKGSINPETLCIYWDTSKGKVIFNPEAGSVEYE